MFECMDTCEKLNQARGPIIRTSDELMSFRKKIVEYAGKPPGTATWLSLTDEEVEGEWKDWPTGDIVDIHENKLIMGDEGCS